MTMQEPDQQQYRRWKRRRLAFRGLALVLLIGVAAFWIVNMGSALSGILGVVFTLLGIFLTLWSLQPRLELQAQADGGLVRGQAQQHLYEQIEGMVLGVDNRKGAIVVYTRKDMRGTTVNLSFGFHDNHLKPDLTSSVVGRRRRGGVVFVAVFSSVDARNCTLYTDSREFVSKVSVLPGRVVEVDWR